MREVQTHFLETLCPLSRPAVVNEVEVPGVVDDLRSQLLQYKVCASSLCLAKGTYDVPNH